MRFFLVGALILSLGACSRESALPETGLPTLASGAKVSLASCPARKCLTVYVAPWCKYCRASTPDILALRDFLSTRDVATRIVVGFDRAEAVAAYARVFGPDTVLDPGNAVAVSGVPHFFVSNGRGAVVREVSGFPAGLGDSASLAAFFGLP